MAVYDRQASIKRNVLLKRRVSRKTLFLLSNCHLFSKECKNRFAIEGTWSEPIEIPVIFQMDKLPKLE